MHHIATPLLLLPGALLPAAAATNEKPVDCLALEEASARLHCYDEYHGRPRAMPASNSAGPAEPIANAAAVNEARRPGAAWLVENSMEPSYVGLGSGLRTGRDQSPDHLLYEAQVAKNIHIFSHELSMGTLRLDLPLRFVVRQTTDDSKPVVTPSYNPGLRLYLVARDSGDGAPHYASLGLFHYSNGQDGAPLLPNGRVNFKTGSFNTNYVELAYHRGLAGASIERRSDWRLSWRRHFTGSWDEAQPRQYPKQQLKLEHFQGLLQQLQLRTSLAYRWGHEYRVFNPVNPELNQDLKTGDRLQVAAELWWTPPAPRWFSESGFGLYLRYDYGHDDYNIRFQQRINRLMLGFGARL